jgi:hypothetical protein
MEWQWGSWRGIWWRYCLCKCFGDLWRRPWWSYQCCSWRFSLGCLFLIILPSCAYADPCIFISLLITTCDCTGPVMTKFTIALREIGTYKEVLRSQVVTAALLLQLCTSVWNARSASLILNSCGQYLQWVMQVEHMLNDRLTQFVSIDLQDVKVCLFFPRETM